MPPKQKTSAKRATSSKQQVQVYHFMIRWSAEFTEANTNSLKEFLSNYCKQWIFQAEETVDPESGRRNPHYQGYMCLHKKKRPSELYNLFNNVYTTFRGMEVQVSHDHEAVRKYSMKSTTRVMGGGPFASENVYTGADLPPEQDFYPWQQQLLQEVKKDPDDRKMIWIYDPIGNTGKTKFAKYLCFHHGAINLGYANSTDALNMVFNNQNKRAYVWNLTRAKPANLSEFDLYSAMESIKDGLFFNSKYNTGQCLMNVPHVVVFANKLPQWQQMSADRWCVMEVQQDKTMVPLIRVAGAEHVPEDAPGHQGQPFNPPRHSAAFPPRQPPKKKKDNQLRLDQAPLNERWVKRSELAESDLETEVEGFTPPGQFDEHPEEQESWREFEFDPESPIVYETDEEGIEEGLEDLFGCGEPPKLPKAVNGKEEVSEYEDDDDADEYTDAAREKLAKQVARVLQRPSPDYNFNHNKRRKAVKDPWPDWALADATELDSDEEDEIVVKRKRKKGKKKKRNQYLDIEAEED